MAGQAMPAPRVPRSRPGSCPLRSLSCVIRSGASWRPLNGSLHDRTLHPRNTGITPARHRRRQAPARKGAGSTRPAWRRGLNPSSRQADASVHCTSCDAVCCRLTVVLDSEDDVPAHMTTRLNGLRVMARDPEGWCVAVDGQRMNCRIHASRPAVCRSFAMGGPCCRSVRAAYARSGSRTIESTLA